MYSNKQRIVNYVRNIIEEIELAEKMSNSISSPEDFGSSISGITVFRAISMSLQYITENFTKIRNLTKASFFAKYNAVPWKEVFGMRNFISHEYADIDAEAIFSTLKNDLPILLSTSRIILNDLENGSLDKEIKQYQE